jgi:hypothetical protein
MSAEHYHNSPPPPSPASLRAAKAITAANILSMLYKGRGLTLTEAAYVIDSCVTAAHVECTEVYDRTASAHRLAILGSSLGRVSMP